MTNTPTPAFVTGLAELAPAYRALLCDVWGVVHNGQHAHEAAGEALIRYRAQGGAVLLITNAPRPKAGVITVLDGFGVPRTAYDDVLTSGDAARSVLAAYAGARIFHVGPDRDLPIYDGLPLTLAGDDNCDVISCTGLFDDKVAVSYTHLTLPTKRTSIPCPTAPWTSVAMPSPMASTDSRGTAWPAMPAMRASACS